MAVQSLDSFLEDIPEKLIELIQKIGSLVPACGLPIYSSLDLREAPWKLCSVDVNLFPGGFSLIHELHKKDAARELQKFFAAHLLKTSPWKIGLVPESHTKNIGYLENILAIKEILEWSGADVTVFWSGPPIPKMWPFRFGTKIIEYHPLDTKAHNLDAIVLNHDLSGLKKDSFDFGNLPVFPNPSLGWHTRKKSQHIQFAQQVLMSMEKDFSWLDCWYFTPYHDLISGFDSTSQESIDYLISRAEVAFEKMRESFEARKIVSQPSLFVKNNAGTYGLGVSVFHSLEELKQNAQSVFKRSFSSGKGRSPVSQLILQEAIPTIYQGQNATTPWAAEPTLYFCNGKIIGGFFRYNEAINRPSMANENLNSPGSQFIDFESERGKELFRLSKWNTIEGETKSKGYQNLAYQFLAKLHMVAAALEECPS